MSKLTDRVDQLFQDWDKPGSPGCALAVIKDGEFIYKRGYGMANLEHDVPIKPETIFDIGSTSKQFTALCILLLARQGKLSLDDPIQKFITEMPEYEHPITIRHLIHHTSGIRDYLVLMVLANMPMENDYQEPEVVGLIANQKALNFKPGDEHLYCNSGYFLMAEIVERVSGKNMRDFAEAHIFGPLGMKNTHFHNNFKEIVANRASGYASREEGGFEIDMGIFDVIGDGAVYTSVEDLYLWDQNYYDNVLDGGGQELIRQMEQLGELNNGEKLEYAFGLGLSTYRGLPTVSHGGAWYGYRAQMLRFPEQRFTVICLANLGTMNPDMLCHQVADIYLQDDFTEEKGLERPGAGKDSIDVSIEILKDKIGQYQDEKSGTLCEVSLGEDGLILDALGYKFTIEPVTELVFKAVNAPASVTLHFEEGNQKINADINDGMMKYIFSRIKAVQFTPGQLKEYEGIYYSPELDTTYQVSAANKVLNITPESPYLKELKITKKDEFNAGLARIKFQRDANEQLIGFSIDAGRVKDIHFQRGE